MIVTGNNQLVKKINKSLVLDSIISNISISRADISKITGLNKATVSSLVSELLDEHLIFESGLGESSGGRRPVMLLFNELAGYSIGIDLGVNYILGVLTDLKGTLIMEKSINFNDSSFELVFEKLREIVSYLYKAAPQSPYGVVGIGIGVPGIIDIEGNILFTSNLLWENIEIRRKIENEFKVPVVISNEANAGAYGEKRFGAGKEMKDLIYVSAGIGIRVGLILNGELYKGINGFSGEMGHSIIETNGKKCRCGNRGCWELYASEYALLKKAEEKKIDLSGKLQLESLLNLAKENNQDVIQLFDEVGKYIGIGINNIIHTFNANHVIIGNRLAKAKKWLEGPINKIIKECTLGYHEKDLKIQFSQLSTYSAALGVSALIIEEFLNLKSVVGE
jgi:predicted NBD/HSP70 family sugar kinase